MDALTIVADLAVLAGLSSLGTARYWRGRARRAEVEAGRLHAELSAERHAARHDPLTGLPNRRAFHQTGAELLADPDRSHVVAAVLDLDNFKQVNDRYGHAVGDEVLIAVARRFATFAGPDLVARLGGDEFAGLLSCPRVDEAWLRQAGRRLATMLAAPVPISGGAVVVTASVGLTPVHDCGDLDDILRRADEAMYRAKTRPSRLSGGATPDHEPACHLGPSTPAPRLEPVGGVAQSRHLDDAVLAAPPGVVRDLGELVGARVDRRRAAEARADADQPAAAIRDEPMLLSGSRPRALTAGRFDDAEPRR